jgi:hypothetical protein
MRVWDAPRKADIMVSELLGSFGDNELSPECLDGAQNFLAEASCPDLACACESGRSSPPPPDPPMKACAH